MFNLVQWLSTLKTFSLSIGNGEQDGGGDGMVLGAQMLNITMMMMTDRN